MENNFFSVNFVVEGLRLVSKLGYLEGELYLTSNCYSSKIG